MESNGNVGVTVKGYGMGRVLEGINIDMKHVDGKKISRTLCTSFLRSKLFASSVTKHGA